MRIPVYQMTFGQDKNGKPGLVFSSEEAGYNSHSILFTIPIVEEFRHPYDFVNILEHQIIYFPFEMNEKYFELIAKINFPELIFSIPETDIQITFEFDDDSYELWPFHSFRRRQFGKHKYIGNENQLIIKNYGFISLLPVDLYEMDELYLKYNGIFVGLTPNFGNIDNLSRQ